MNRYLNRYLNYSKYQIKRVVPKAIWFNLAEIKKRELKEGKSGLFPPNGKDTPLFYVIRRQPPAAGLFSNMNHVLQGLIEAQSLKLKPVIDMENYWTDYSQPNNYQNTFNSWEYFFKQPFDLNLKEVYLSERFVESPLNRILKGHWLGSKSLDFVLDSKKMESLYQLQRNFIKLNDFTSTLLDKIKEEIVWEPKLSVGASYRGTDYLEIQPHGHAKQPTLEEFYTKVISHRKKTHSAKIYIASEDPRVRQIFGNSKDLYPNFRDYDFFKKFVPRNKFYRKYADENIVKTYSYLIEMYLLSETDTVVTTLANGSVMALILNGGKYRDPYIFNLGSY
jgi:hypothetical protein